MATKFYDKKKIDIYPHNVEALLRNDENVTRFVNSLIEKYFNKEIIFLNKKNKENLLEICGDKNYDINEIVNDSLELIDIITPDKVMKVRVELTKKKVTARLRGKENYVTN